MDSILLQQSPTHEPSSHNNITNPPRPFIKWVGGKRQLLPELIKRKPRHFKNYIEPFIGGGALMWTIDIDSVDKIVINDFNSELINLYNVVRNKPDKLIRSMARHKNNEKYYYKIRALDREDNYHRKHSVTRASRFLFLNKTAFNGLYRVNKSGHHNVPYNHDKSPNFLDEANIKSCSKFLQNVTILNGDFEIVRSEIDSNSFVYLDPPYAPISNTSSFTSYTDNGFDWNMQVRLKRFCDYVDSVGAKFMVSNSTSQFIYSLYSDYKIDEVKANRNINSQGRKRGKISELIIRNY